ncbi:MAG: hypothetical protein AAF604_14970 [Acidobacteriota bacterium]
MKRNALIILTLLSLPLFAYALSPAALTKDPPGQWVPTGSSDCRAGEVCVQWCRLIAGREVPSGISCCLPQELVYSTDRTACSSRRLRR